MSYMKTEWIVVWTAIGTILLVLLVAIVVAATGSITVGADVKPGLIERALAPWACDRSVERHAPRCRIPMRAIRGDRRRHGPLPRELPICHGAPGIPATEIAKGLNPPPHRLAAKRVTRRTENCSG